MPDEQKSNGIGTVIATAAGVLAMVFLLVVGFVFLTCGGMCR